MMDKKIKEKIINSLTGMKEKEFIEELKEINLYDGINMKVYYYLDENGNVILDGDSMREEFENRLNEIKEILGGN